MGQKRRLVNPFDSRVQSTKKRTFCFYDSTLTRWLSSGSFSFQIFCCVCQPHPRRRLIPAGRAFNYVHAVSYGRVDLFLKNKFKLIVEGE